MPTLQELQAMGGVPVQVPGSMTLEQLQAQGATPVEPQEQEQPGYLEAFGRGALQGVTFGFGDEIQGALESIFTDKTYQQARDAAREANARAQAAHSTTYGAGEIGGGIAGAFVPGLDIAEGAGLGTVAAKSALAGGLGGLGTSEATDVGGVLKDVGAGAIEGALGGAVAHGAGKLASKALSGAEAKAAESVSYKLSSLASKAEESGEKAVKVSDIVRNYESKLSELSKSPGNKPEIKELTAIKDDVLSSWAPKLEQALKSEDASTPAVREAMLRQLDEQVPIEDVKKYVAKLDAASDAESAKKIRESALGSIVGHGGTAGAVASVLHGNIPGAVAALALPKAIEKLPAAGRFAASQAARANQVLEQIANAAKMGNPWAQAQIRMLRSTPVGAARLAQLGAQTVAAPVDQQAQEAQ